MHEASAQLLSCLPSLRRYARALVGDRNSADDLVQDTLERGWRKLATRQRDGDMRAWLFTIMHNLHIDSYRKPAIATEAIDDDTIFPDAAGDHTQGLQLREMDRALAALPVEQREILLLVALEQMSYEQVAATLDVPIGTVMSRLSRARERLRLALDGRAAVSSLKVVK
ncbi:RNA polymerase sigma factor [Oxalobacteraceae bacterium CAVE-383]|nr:RNA polymerase sigma factor [Oxalobacteraceae bacterium CAVE-383]